MLKKLLLTLLLILSFVYAGNMLGFFGRKSEKLHKKVKYLLENNNN